MNRCLFSSLKEHSCTYPGQWVLINGTAACKILLRHVRPSFAIKTNLGMGYFYSFPSPGTDDNVIELQCHVRTRSTATTAESAQMDAIVNMGS